MKVYTYSEARQQLARLLDESQSEGEVRIRRRDGTVFSITVVEQLGSPLDVRDISAGVSHEQIIESLRDIRERSE